MQASQACPTADVEEPDDDLQEVYSSSEGCWVRFKGTSLELASVAGENSGASDNLLFWVYRRLPNPPTSSTLTFCLNGQCPSLSISSFSMSNSPCSSIVPSASSTCGNGYGECCLNLAKSLFDCIESPLESILGHDSSTGGVGITPDATPLPLTLVLTENQEICSMFTFIGTTKRRRYGQCGWREEGIKGGWLMWCVEKDLPASSVCEWCGVFKVYL